MSAHRKPRYAPAGNRQRGQAMLFTVLLLVVGVAALVYNFLTPATQSIERDKKTAAALAEARAALIGWSASRTPPDLISTIRPGELPCPDIDNTGTDAGGCVAGAIGRVPWRSLGIPEPKDSAGETLWYTIAGPFRNYSQSSAPITSNTLGSLTVYLGSSATTLTSQAIAVLFAPGTALGAQNRDSATSASCTTTGTTIPRNLCATNYLEATAGGNNTQTGGPFIQAQPSATFNDRLLVITNADLMPVVEQRVAREMRTILQNYKTATAASTLYLGGIYPWADRGDGNSNDGENRGRFPCGTASPVDWNSPVPLSIPSTNTPALPQWLRNGCGSNAWARVIYYSSGRNWLNIADVSCPLCLGPSLNVNGAPGFELVLLTPGAASVSPRGTWTNDPGDTITGYFEDPENSDNNDDSYVTPTSTAYNRDRIYTVP